MKEWYYYAQTDCVMYYIVTDGSRSFRTGLRADAEWLVGRLNGDDVDIPEDCQ